MKLVLFDLDGTLMLTGGAGRRAMERAGTMVLGKTFDMEGIVIGGGMDPLLYAATAQRMGVDDHERRHDDFRETYLLELARELESHAADVRIMPGFPNLIEHLLAHDQTAVGMVTGNYAAAVPVKLNAINFPVEWFSHNGFGDEGPTRPDLVRLAMERYAASNGGAIEPGDVIIVGDTPRDVHCAKANDCLCLGVATGFYTAQQLTEEGADVAVDDLGDAGPLWELMGLDGPGN